MIQYGVYHKNMRIFYNIFSIEGKIVFKPVMSKIVARGGSTYTNKNKKKTVI
jgi:hypothetical protein